MTLATGREELLVPGREGKAFEKAPAKADLRLLEFAREGGICSSANWPKTRPVAAAAAAVPAPMSCFYIRKPTVHNPQRITYINRRMDILDMMSWANIGLPCATLKSKHFSRVGF